MVTALVVGLVYAYHNRHKFPFLSLTLPHSPIQDPPLPQLFPQDRLWIRPKAAPNGAQWPSNSGYVANYPRLNDSGLASVIADNSGGSSDLFVKLFDRDQKPMKAVRVILLKARDKATLQHVTPGHYDLRYRNLDNGQIRKSPKFEITVKRESETEEYMSWSVPLYVDSRGTIYHKEISDRDFQ